MLMERQNKTGSFKNVKVILFFIILGFTALLPAKTGAAEENTVYKDGIYCYKILNEGQKEAALIGLDSTKVIKELFIPGSAVINGSEYRIAAMGIDWIYSHKPYDAFYQGITKLSFAENFSGTLTIYQGQFKNLRTIEFRGKSIPEEINVSLTNLSFRSDFLFIVPKGMEAAYSKVIHEYMNYGVWSDLYEKTIDLTPTIAAAETSDIEYGCFSMDGLIYQVISSAKGKTGAVQLIGVTGMLDYSYLALPEKVTNNGYTYKLTKLCSFGLIACGATAVKVPDSVTEMESGVFDYKVELLYLSKNCRIVPSFLTTDENHASNLRFVSIPEGVTTISARAFYGSSENENSIILPTTIKTLGEGSLKGFDLVTFLNKKPIGNISSAIKSGATVKVNKASVSTYKASLGSKAKVIEAKNVVKAAKLSVSKNSLQLDTYKTYKLTGTLTKGSNETVFWFSSDPGIFELSSNGTINPKQAGTAYAIAYTRTSGLLKAVKVTVANKLITKDIYTYRINNAKLKTVSLYSVKPKDTTKELSIPETVSFGNASYKVTGACADPDHPEVPIISDKYAENKITKITFPKTITGEVGYLGILKNMKSIVFLGTKPPEWIKSWNGDGGLLSFQAVIYVPKNCVNAYNKVILYSYGFSEEPYSAANYSYLYADFQILENGSTQFDRFIEDGILYRVTKKAGSKNGTVAVAGADVNLKEIKIKSTVKHGSYSYDVTQINLGAFRECSAETIILNDSVTKVELGVFGEKVKHIVWSGNCKTIDSGIFSLSNDFYDLNDNEQQELLAKNNYYALETFIIPFGVTEIEPMVFDSGFGNVKSVTVPASVTKIGQDAFKSITEVLYE